MDEGRRKRRRYDSDDDEGEGDDVGASVVATTRSIAEDALLEDIDVDNDLLERFGVDDLITSDNGMATSGQPDRSDEEAEEGNRSGSVASTSAIERNALSDGVPPTGHSSKQNGVPTITQARIAVARHVRRLPRNEVVAEDDSAKLRKFLDGARERPNACSAEAILAFYRRRRADGVPGSTAEDPTTTSTERQWENRFGIAPGWRWDGVVRGTGAEAHYFPSH